MLDLGKLQQDDYKIKLVNGAILQLPKPSQKLLRRMVGIQGISNSENLMLEEIYNILFDMFNTNKNGINFTKEDIGKMFDLSTALIVIEDYINFSFNILGE